MKKFEEPTAELIRVAFEDVIVTSFPCDDF